MKEDCGITTYRLMTTLPWLGISWMQTAALALHPKGNWKKPKMKLSTTCENLGGWMRTLPLGTTKESCGVATTGLWQSLPLCSHTLNANCCSSQFIWQETVTLVHSNGSDKLLKWSCTQADLTSWYDALGQAKHKGKLQDSILLHGENEETCTWTINFLK